MAATLIKETAIEPLTLNEAKSFLRVEHSADDDLIASLIKAPRSEVESATRRAQIAWDTQLGVAALMARIVAADNSLALPAISSNLPKDHPINLAKNEMPETKKIQARLNDLGAKPLLALDGIYGSKTKRATRELQKRNGLQDDGIIGPVIWKAMNVQEAA